MSLTIRGDNQLIELEPERSYSVRDGWRTVRRWKGTKEAVNLFIPTLLIDGTNIRVIPDEGPTATLEGWFDNAQDGSAVTDTTPSLTESAETGTPNLVDAISSSTRRASAATRRSSASVAGRVSTRRVVGRLRRP